MSAARTAFYPGSFDPPTNGHVEVARAAARLADRLVIGVGIHPGKTPLFTAEERLDLLREVFEPIAEAEGARLDCVTFDNLVVDAAEAQGAHLLIRGLRDGTDLDYEMQMAGMNAVLKPAVQTIFLPASPIARPITATLVRQIAAMGGDVSAFVPPAVLARLTARFPRR
ncbi:MULTISPECIES: pantetheine-phosphate adenylyltransferase [unclassified Ancylobacter]|uniref:pantetheine-phosphate adenylyltransferase n=1 Tax=unclassified Ancylobacter TaxID=2626613 RepID=UPI0022703941|nr:MULTISPECIES: pantetheine-phosphate adenylyltransferase [unclassified Ancylobacter]WAC26362.1 pantetheine-phosphate adenylyltransferase [Ancylobacter sp. SL191]WGD31264.1 pantetheine-phosphate adenylyltransferase [Ancylobacter sp. WKF20]